MGGTTEKLHSNAAQMLGLVVHNKEEIRKEKENKEAPKEGFFARRFSRKSLTPIESTQLNEHQDELDVHLAKESVIKKKAMNSALRGSIGAGQLKLQTKLNLREQRKKR